MLCSFYSVSISQQTITSIINYESGWQGNLNHTTCNIFNISPFSIISGATHYPVSGGAIRASSSPLILKAQGDPTNRSSVVAGVAYAFGYPIKAGFTYNVSANVFRTKVTGGSSTAATNFEIGTTATLPNPNQAGTLPTACSMVSYSNLTAVLPFKRGGTAIGNSSAQNLNVVQNYTPYY